jgi:cell division protein FtsW
MKHTFRQIDKWLFFTVLALMGFSILVIYSIGAGIALAKNNPQGTTDLLYNQIFRVGIGLLALCGGMFIPYQWYSLFPKNIFKKRSSDDTSRLEIPIAKWLLYGTMMLLLVVLIWGNGANNTNRFLSMGFISFQPSEIARYVLIIYLAWSLSRKNEYSIRNFWWGFVPKILPVALIVGLIILEPHFSVSGIMLIVSCGMLYFARARVTHLLIVFTVLLFFAAVWLLFNPYAKQRIVSKFERKTEHIKNDYQIRQSLIAFGSGGILGVAPGESKQRDLFLPEPMGDFVYAIIGEEYGFVGTTSLAFAFLFVVLSGIKISSKATDDYAKLLALGLTANIGVQTFVNMAVTLDVFFLTGLPLPFISYGGTSMFASSFAVGILLNVSSQSRQRAQELSGAECSDEEL